MQLINLLESGYRARAPVLYPLIDLPEKRVYRVDLEGRATWVARTYDVASNRRTAAHLCAVLSFLEEVGYPSERIVRTADGASLTTMAEGRQVLVTTFIRGAAADFSAPSLSSLGKALGHLHALNTRASDGMMLALPTAEMLPANELRWAATQLAGVELRVPRSLRARYDTLVSAVQNIDRCEDLPTVVIHNDCHPANSVVTPEGTVVLCDWEGAGLGPAVIDVGFLLVSCEIPYLSTAPLGPDHGRVAAVVDGYCTHHRLTRQDLDRLPDAIRFRSIVAGAASFAAAIAEGRAAEVPSWWWNRYTAANEIADRATRRFQTYQ